MRKHLVWCLAVVAVLLCVRAMSGAPRQRDTWEYTVSGDITTAELNRLGADGWEVTAAAQDSGGRIRAILKRHKG